ncbi:unnamed protein product [Porites lobata]|uniref:Uncharacterized protein n=1 Tax=Porites lobata TaxID=104759 RepID=A0ABN8S8L2_9CNID|nr:unnamed protein product [Porites lobata]
MDALRKKIQDLQEDVFSKRMMVEELTRQKEAEERHVLLKNVRMELMAKVEQTELKLQRKLQHRQMVLTELIKLSLGRLVQQKKLEAVQRKATSFMEELSRNEKRARAWRENLRRVGSESNIHTAVLQPRLVSYVVLTVIN